MARMVRNCCLLLIFTLAELQPVAALACERHPDSASVAAASHAGHETGQGQGTAPSEAPDEQSSCPAMLACGAGAALPSPVTLPSPRTVAGFAIAPVFLAPPSRADAPANPPPKA